MKVIKKRASMIETPDYQKIGTEYKEWGHQFIPEEKRDLWDTMIEELANEKMLGALKAAIFTMRDLNNGVDFNIIEHALQSLCKSSSIKAVIYRVLYNFTPKGPEFLMQSSLFKPFEGLGDEAQELWNDSLIKVQKQNDELGAQITDA